MNEHEVMVPDSEGAWICKRHKADKGHSKYGKNCHGCSLEKIEQLQAEVATAIAENKRLNELVFAYESTRSPASPVLAELEKAKEENKRLRGEIEWLCKELLRIQQTSLSLFEVKDRAKAILKQVQPEGK